MPFTHHDPTIARITYHDDGTISYKGVRFQYTVNSNNDVTEVRYYTPRGWERGPLDVFAFVDRGPTKPKTQQGDHAHVSEVRTPTCPSGRNKGKAWSTLSDSDLQSSLTFFVACRDRELSERVVAEINHEITTRQQNLVT